MVVNFMEVTKAVKDKLLYYANKRGWRMHCKLDIDSGLYLVNITFDEPIFFTHIEGKWGMYLNSADESIYFDEYEIGVIEIL